LEKKRSRQIEEMQTELDDAKSDLTSLDTQQFHSQIDEEGSCRDPSSSFSQQGIDSTSKRVGEKHHSPRG